MSLHPATGAVVAPLIPVTQERAITVKVLRKKDMAKKLGCSLSTIDNRLNPNSRWHDKSFPRPVLLGAGGSRSAVKGWLEHVVDAWLQARMEEEHRG